MNIDLNPSLATQGTACAVRNSDHGVVKVEKMSSRGQMKGSGFMCPFSGFKFHEAEQSKQSQDRVELI